MGAGRLSERLRFYRRAEGDDGAGNRRAGWELQFDAWADMSARAGSEVFTAARMEGRSPFSVRIRRTAASELIKQDWMARDDRGVEYRIVAPAFDPRDRAMMMMTLISGSALE